MIFRLFTVVLFAVLPLICKASAAEMILKVDISPEEKSILARGWTQQEIEQESAALLAYPEKPEKVSENAEYWKKRFFGSGVTVFSKCFRNYTEKYMKKFLSPEGILTGETADIMYKKCWDYEKDLRYIKDRKLPFEISCINPMFVEGKIIFYTLELMHLYANDSAEFDQLNKEWCFWHAFILVNYIPDSYYHYDLFYAAGAPLMEVKQLMDSLEEFERPNVIESQIQSQEKRETSCCTIL